MRKKIKIAIAAFAAAAVLAAGAYVFFSMRKNEVLQSQKELRQASSLQEAVSLNNLEAVKFLLKSGADLEQRFNKSAVDGAESEGFTALGWALFANRPEIARYLIEQGADVTASVPMNSSMLYWAITYEHADIALLLIEKGADIYPSGGYNPALHAKILGMDDVVLKLAEKGVEPAENDYHHLH